MLSDRQLQALVLRFQLQLAIVGERTAAATAKAWDQLPSVDRTDIEAYVRATAPVVAGSKSAAVSLANGFYSTALQVRTPAIKAAAIANLFDPEAPFLAAWHALKEGRPYIEAVAAGRSQAEAAARNSVISTSRRTADAVIEAGGQRTVGWRRVLDGKACEWCQLVSTQRYRTAESADFGHDRCGCTPLPILGDRDPGRVINKELLRKLKDEGVVDKISAQRALPRAREAQANAQRRVDRLRAELAAEKDQERETRLERRLEKARADLAKFDARVVDLSRG